MVLKGRAGHKLRLLLAHATKVGCYEEEGSESVRNNAVCTYIHDRFCYKSKITAHCSKVAVILTNKRG
jgi:hypothetical protein